MKRLAIFSILATVLFLGLSSIIADDDDVNADELFAELDKNKDGKVTSDEVSEKQKKFFDRLLRVGDADKNKSLSKSEFVKALNPDDEPLPPTPELGGNRAGRRGQFNPDQFFKFVDKNKDGKITRDELPEQARERFGRIFDRLGKDELTKTDLVKLQRDAGSSKSKSKKSGKGKSDQQPGGFFDKLDQNGDGKITVAEVPERARRIVEQMLKRAGKGAKDSLTKEEFQKIAQRGGKSGTDRQPTDKARPSDRPQSDKFRGPAIFRLLDSNRDGKLTRAELTRVAQLFDQLDKDKNGSLDPRELLGSPSKSNSNNRSANSDRPRRPAANSDKTFKKSTDAGGTEQVNRAFQRLDKNKDDKLSKSEAPEKMRERFSRIDANSDGFVDRAELTRAFNQLRRGQSKKKK